MFLTENSNQVFLPGGATNSQNSPYISVWPLDQIDSYNYLFHLCVDIYVLVSSRYHELAAVRSMAVMF